MRENFKQSRTVSSPEQTESQPVHGFPATIALSLTIAAMPGRTFSPLRHQRSRTRNRQIRDLNGRRVAKEGDRHLETLRRDVADGRLDVVRDPLDEIARVLVPAVGKCPRPPPKITETKRRWSKSAGTRYAWFTSRPTRSEASMAVTLRKPGVHPRCPNGLRAIGSSGWALFSSGGVTAR